MTVASTYRPGTWAHTPAAVARAEAGLAQLYQEHGVEPSPLATETRRQDWPRWMWGHRCDCCGEPFLVRRELDRHHRQYRGACAALDERSARFMQSIGDQMGDEEARPRRCREADDRRAEREERSRRAHPAGRERDEVER